MKNQKSKKKINVSMLILGIVLGIYTVSMFIPMIWGFLASLKDPLEFRIDKLGLPKNWLFSNYSTALKVMYVDVQTNSGIRKVYILEMLLNTLLYAVGGSLIQTFVQYVMAYVSARFKYKFGAIVYGIVIFAMAFPQVGSTVSSLEVAGRLGLLDSILGMFVIRGYFLGMYFLVFYAQLRAFPKDYSEAAYIDGAGNFTVMMRIIFPLVRGTFFTVTLLLFINSWNDYTTPMLYMPNVPTLSYGLYYYTFVLKNSSTQSFPMRMAGCIVMMLPILAVFLVFHKRLIGNVSMGGIKE